MLRLVGCVLVHARSRLGSDDCQPLVRCLRAVLCRQAALSREALARAGDALLQAVASESTLPRCADAMASARVLGTLSARGLLQTRYPEVANMLEAVDWGAVVLAGEAEADGVAAAQRCCQLTAQQRRQQGTNAPPPVNADSPLLQEVAGVDGVPVEEVTVASDDDELDNYGLHEDQVLLVEAWSTVERDVCAAVLTSLLHAGRALRLATGDGALSANAPVLAVVWQDAVAAVTHRALDAGVAPGVLGDDGDQQAHGTCGSLVLVANKVAHFDWCFASEFDWCFGSEFDWCFCTEFDSVFVRQFLRQHITQCWTSWRCCLTPARLLACKKPVWRSCTCRSSALVWRWLWSVVLRS